MADHFKSEPMVIGRFAWRVIVMDHWTGNRVHNYQFKPVDGLPMWEDCRKWPTYDPDNGATAGLPPELRTLYQRNLVEIDKALGKIPAIEGVA